MEQYKKEKVARLLNEKEGKKEVRAFGAFSFSYFPLDSIPVPNDTGVKKIFALLGLQNYMQFKFRLNLKMKINEFLFCFYKNYNIRADN